MKKIGFFETENVATHGLCERHNLCLFQNVTKPLNIYAESLSRVLVVIFRLSLSQGIVPADWCIARVIPVFKKGNNALITKYRPLSLRSACWKLLEHIISNYMINFLDAHNVLSPFQH